MPFFTDDYEDPEASELRAEARAERRRMRPHWCRDCLGHTGPGSPCAPDDEDDDSGFDLSRALDERRGSL